MLLRAILLGLVGVVAVIDSRLIGRQNIGKPLVLNTLTGLMLGDLHTGIVLGASLELISMGFVSIGATGPLNMQLDSIIATAFAILTNNSTGTALTIVIPAAVAGESMSIIMRMIIAQFGHAADRAIENNKFRKAQIIHIYWSFVFSAFVYFTPILLTVYFGADVVADLVDKISEMITDASIASGNMLSTLGFAMLLSAMLSKKLYPYFIFGFFIVAYLDLSLIDVTVFAVLTAFVMDQVKYGEREEAHS